MALFGRKIKMKNNPSFCGSNCDAESMAKRKVQKQKAQV